MNKSLLKGMNSLIKDLGNYDYISRVRYVIFLVSKVLYDCKANGFRILDENFHSYKSTPYFLTDKENIFNEYEYFNLGIYEAEERIFNLIASGRQNFDLNNFRPARLYEALLTSRERKNLGQVYTPAV